MIPEKDVTVVIPVYNRQSLICRALDSVYAQARRPARIIVVDNNSSDESVKVVTDWQKQHPDITLDLFTETTRGAWAARNRGLEIVQTEWVSFFDSDDAMRPNLLECAAAVADNADIIYWKAATHDGDRHAVKRFSTRNHLRRHIFNSILGTQQYMVRTEFVRRVGAWQNLPVWDDWELGVRLLFANPRLQPIPKILVDIYAQDLSITGRSFSAKQGCWERVIDSVDADIEKCDISSLQWKGYMLHRLHGMTDYVRVVLAAQYAREGNMTAAQQLLKDTLHRSKVAAWRKCLLKLIYNYTRVGGRAAYCLWY
jgi:hypothetical protein